MFFSAFFSPGKNSCVLGHIQTVSARVLWVLATWTGFVFSDIVQLHMRFYSLQ